MILRRQRLLLIASGLLVLIAASIGHSVVPLYDGVGFPDEPYRYVDKSQHPKSLTPDSPSLPFTPQTTQQGFTLTSSEQGPQVSIYIDPSAIVLSKNVQYGTVSVQALAPTTEPSDGTIDGNVYRLSGTVNEGTFAIKNTQKNTFNDIQLRLPQGFPPNPTIEYRPLNSGAWQRLSTYKIGNDIYESADLANQGDYALVTLNKTATSQQHTLNQHNSGPYLAIALGGPVVVLAILIALIRLKQPKAPLS